MDLFAVYKIHNIETDMDYIGWSVNPISRVFEQHEKTDSYIGNAIRLYGWDAFEIDILHLVKTKKEVCRLEIEEITKYNSMVPNGYNLTRGGEGNSGLKWTEESREKQSKAMRGIKKPGTKKAMMGNKRNTGKNHSKKAKIKMSIARTKYWLTKLEEEL